MNDRDVRHLQKGRHSRPPRQLTYGRLWIVLTFVGVLMWGAILLFVFV